MARWRAKAIIVVACLVLGACWVGPALANGGPFVVRYPSGDPAAKGVLARLDPDLKPRRETRLRVVKEDLRVTFALVGYGGQQPRAEVLASYVIENPTTKAVDMDFGFPILRGIYLTGGMDLRPDVKVRVSGKETPCSVISNSAIYGIIREDARKVIEHAVMGDVGFGKVVSAVRNSKGAARKAARARLSEHLTGRKKWNSRDAALMVEYASLDLSKPPVVYVSAPYWPGDAELHKLTLANLGPLAAIGEQKATQFFAQLASRFDKKVATSYEAIFEAWGGDVRERSVDLKTGRVRPREITVAKQASGAASSRYAAFNDPTVYARVDYLDENTRISDEDKASCKAILKNLPVVFTFAPMNLLHYRVTFPAKSKKTVTVGYSQYPYLDTREPASYQLAYVVHPASLWGHFGPINLTVAAPEAADFRASVRCRKVRVEQRAASPGNSERKTRYAIYSATVRQKTGELLLGVESAPWATLAKAAAPPPPPPPPPPAKGS